MGGTIPNLGTLKVAKLELLHDLIPDYVRGCKEPAAAARLLVSDGSGLELDLGVEYMGYSNLGFARSQGGLYVIVSQDGARELNLWIGCGSGFPGINVGELDGPVARLGH